jgi:hypothetical protein
MLEVVDQLAEPRGSGCLVGKAQAAARIPMNDPCTLAGLETHQAKQLARLHAHRLRRSDDGGR